MGLTDIFKLQWNDERNVEQLVSALTSFRENISKAVYDKWKISVQEQLPSLLWINLDMFWRESDIDVQDLIASTVGQTLLVLGPFYAKRLMTELIEIINKTAHFSMLQYSSYVYLAGFFTSAEMLEWLSMLNLEKLHGPMDEYHIKLLKTELSRLPKEVLPAIANIYIKEFESNSSNKLYLKAIKRIVEVTESVYLDVIRTDLPLEVLGKSFAPSMPLLQPELATSLSERALTVIRDRKASPDDFESACAILRALFMTDQVPRTLVHGYFTQKGIRESPSLAAVLTLPIEKDIVMSIYGLQNWRVNMVELAAGGMLDYDPLPTEDCIPESSEGNLYDSVLLPRSETDSTLDISSFTNEDENENEKPSHSEDEEEQMSELTPEEVDHAEVTLFGVPPPPKPSSEALKLPPLELRNIASPAASPSKNMTLPPISPVKDKGLAIHNYAGFISSNSSIDYQSMDTKFLVPLMKYFCYFPEYQHELCTLIIRGFSSDSDDVFTEAVDVVILTMNDFKKETLNCILWEMIGAAEKSPQRKKKTVKLLGHVKLDLLVKQVANRLIGFIEREVKSTTETMKRNVRNSVVSLYHNSSASLFNTLLAPIVTKLDIWDEINFEYILGFLADVFRRVPAKHISSYSHLAVLFSETISMYTFPRRILADIFRIVSVFCESFTDPKTELTEFIRVAVNVLECTYLSFTGSAIGVRQTGRFSHRLAKINVTGGMDTSLINNHTASHRQLMKCGAAAFSFISSIPWDKMELTRQEVSYLSDLCLKFAKLFPYESTRLMEGLVKENHVTRDMLTPCLSAISATTAIEIAELSRLVLACRDSYPDIEIDIQRIKTQLEREAMYFRGMSYADAKVLQDFCASFSIDIDGSVYRQMVFEDERCNWCRDALENEEDAQDFNDDSASDNEDDDAVELEVTELEHYLCSITPLVYANLDVPASWLPSSIVISYCQYSRAKISEKQCEDLVKFCIETRSSRSLFYVLRYAQANKFNIDIVQYLNCPVMWSRKLFQFIFSAISAKRKSLAGFSAIEREYIERITGDDIFQFCKNATTADRRIAGQIIHFDPVYFIENYKQVDEFTRSELINLFYYVQLVPAIRDDCYGFLKSLLQKYVDDRNMNRLIYRMISVFMQAHGMNVKSAAKDHLEHICQQLKLNESGESTEDITRLATPSHLLEIYFATVTIQKFYDCSPIQNAILTAFGNNTPWSQRIRFGKSLNPKDFATSFQFYLPSMKTASIEILVREMKNPGLTLPQHITKLILQHQYTLTGPIMDNWYIFAYGVCTKPDAHAYIPMILSLAKRVMYTSSLECARTINLMKHVLPLFPANSEETFKMCEFVLGLIKSGKYPFSAVDLFTQICTKNRNFTLLDTVYKDYLSGMSGYHGVLLAETKAMHDLMITENQTDVSDVIHSSSYFYAMFNALVSIEKKNRRMTHTNMIERYKGMHKRALEYLLDPKMRIFAPWFAMAETDFDIPHGFDDFIQNISDKIQRIHTVDHCHEF